MSAPSSRDAPPAPRAAPTPTSARAPDASLPDLRSLFQIAAGEPKARALERDGTPDLEQLIRRLVREELEFLKGYRNSNEVIPALPQSASSTPAAQVMTGSEVMSADELAAFLQVDRNTVYDYAGRGLIPCRRLGKRILFHRQAIVTWLNPCKVVDRKG